jgi:hypothetical protein
MIERLAYELETELIKAIAKSLAGNADWKLYKLAQFNQKALAIVNRFRARMLSGVDKEMEGAVAKLLAEIGGVSMSPGMKEIVTRWAASAKSSVNLAMAKMAESAGASYVFALNKASMALITAESTRKEALKRAIGELHSLTAFVDDAGRQWSPEGYISTVMRSNMGRAVNASQMQAAADLNTDLVEVTAHAGARPKCAPYQSRVLSITGNTPGYPALSSTSYGEPDGLLGINCGHRLIPFIPGVSKRSPKLKLTAKENKRIYEQSQQQRGLERSIRAAKREQAKWDAAGDKEMAQQWGAKVKDRQAKMRSFIKDTGRTRRGDREQIYA